MLKQLHPLQKAILIFAIGGTLWFGVKYQRGYSYDCGYYSDKTGCWESLGASDFMDYFVPGEIVILSIAGVAWFTVKAMKPKQ
jgi:hypothetical protein